MRIPGLAPFPLTAAFLAAAVAGALAALPQPARADDRGRIALADIYYLDTSGEPGDQTRQHAERVKLFEGRLAEGLRKSGFTVVDLACGAETCSIGNLGVADAVGAAAKQQANYVLLGAIQKVSTLVGTGRIDILDVAAGKDVFTKVLQFRGDSDEAFRQAARFVVENIDGATFDAAAPGPHRASSR